MKFFFRGERKRSRAELAGAIARLVTYFNGSVFFVLLPLIKLKYDPFSLAVQSLLELEIKPLRCLFLNL